jgi:transcriptional regulator
MYIPAAFKSEETAEALALMRAYPFATLLTVAGGETHITHLPVLVEDDGLLAHMARANPHWQHFAGGSSIALFHGPHAYISPDWYANPDREVPTWNYAAVHAHGRPQLIEGRDDKLALIDRSVALFEAPNTPPWTRKVEGARLDALLGAIVAFRMPVERIEAKFKMNQNRKPEDRAIVTRKLRETLHPDLMAMAQWMEAHERS